jgi:hypothetical protein
MAGGMAGVMTSPTQFEFPDDRPITDRPSRSRPASRGFARFLVAICIGIAGTLAWQSYGEATKQIIAKRAPELGWSPEAKQVIASSIEWLGWTKSPSLETTAPQTIAPKAPALQQQMMQDLAALREMVQQLTAGQDQTTREIAKLESAVVEILMKIPEPPPQPPAAPARKPAPVPTAVVTGADSATVVATTAMTDAAELVRLSRTTGRTSSSRARR